MCTVSNYPLITSANQLFTPSTNHLICTSAHLHIFSYLAPTNQSFLPMNRPFVYIILLFSVNLLYAQHPPEGISHQAVIRGTFAEIDWSVGLCCPERKLPSLCKKFLLSGYPEAVGIFGIHVSPVVLQPDVS